MVDPNIEDYARTYSSPESELLRKINRETHAHVLKPRMLSGHMQGRFLAMVSKMIKPKHVLEIGTYTGYSALCLAEGLDDKGLLTTIDVNEELETRVRGYFNESAFKDRIHYIIEDARTAIPKLMQVFDLVWIDADKENYALYFDLIFRQVRVGGFILADNVLWSGKVVEANPDKDTRAIQAFNIKIQQDIRLENMLLPLRDGILMIRKLRD